VTRARRAAAARERVRAQNALSDAATIVVSSVLGKVFEKIVARSGSIKRGV